ncbi:MAG: prolyl oligopeptidase family serine peptidase [Actinomycetaceae bacterium]|nr:prolyl oligopeptidase family serine peptidase [Actinomycetaceae bacterium]
MPTSQPYGSWNSPISTDSLGKSIRRIEQVALDGQNAYWVEARSAEAGRNVLMRYNQEGQVQEVLPPASEGWEYDVRTSVHEYGGQAYAVLDSLIIFSCGRDHLVYSYKTDSPLPPVPLTGKPSSRFADLYIDARRSRVYAIHEDHSQPGPCRNSIVAIPLDGTARLDASRVTTLWSDSDFVSSLCLSPDGRFLSFISWDHPHMPWSKAVLRVAQLDAAGEITSCIALTDGTTAPLQARWSPLGELIFADNPTRWWNLWRIEGWDRIPEGASWSLEDLRFRPLNPGSRDHCGPGWYLGACDFEFLDADMLVSSWSEGGTRKIGSIKISNGETEAWPLQWFPQGQVRAKDGLTLAVMSSWDHPTSLVAIKNGQVTVIRSSMTEDYPHEYIARPRLLEWASPDGLPITGWYYPPTSPEYSGPSQDLPPLILNVHGGPTAEALPGFDPTICTFTSRGFAYLDVNYRGSWGRGTDFVEALNGCWGVKDVADCVSGAQAAVSQKLADPSRLAIRGISAGGFTTLAALTSTSVFTAGCDISGPADLLSMASTTHKYETYYVDSLVGTLDREDPVWMARSPITRVAEISAPLLIQQGEIDKVVPLEQSRIIYKTLLEEGKPVALRVFTNEGHGFMSSRAISLAHAAELAFYRRIWNITPPSEEAEQDANAVNLDNWP